MEKYFTPVLPYKDNRGHTCSKADQDDYHEVDYGRGKTISPKSQKKNHLPHQQNRGHYHHLPNYHHHSEDNADHDTHSTAEDCAFKHKHDPHHYRDKTKNCHHHGRQRKHIADGNSHNPVRATSSSSSSSSCSSSSSSSHSLSSDSYVQSIRKHPQRQKPQLSKSCTDIFDELDYTTPLVDNGGHLMIPARATGERGSASHLGNARSFSRNEQRISRTSGIDGSVRKAKSMEILISREEEEEPENEDEIQRRKNKARKDLVREKLRFSDFLNEITRQVLSPQRLATLGVTDAHRPSSSGQASPKMDRRMESPRPQMSRPASADSIDSSSCTHASVHSDSSPHTHNKDDKRMHRHHKHHHHSRRDSPQSMGKHHHHGDGKTNHNTHHLFQTSPHHHHVDHSPTYHDHGDHQHQHGDHHHDHGDHQHQHGDHHHDHGEHHHQHGDHHHDHGDHHSPTHHYVDHHSPGHHHGEHHHGEHDHGEHHSPKHHHEEHHSPKHHHGEHHHEEHHSPTHHHGEHHHDRHDHGEHHSPGQHHVDHHSPGHHHKDPRNHGEHQHHEDHHSRTHYHGDHHHHSPAQHQGHSLESRPGPLPSQKNHCESHNPAVSDVRQHSAHSDSQLQLHHREPHHQSDGHPSTLSDSGHSHQSPRQGRHTSHTEPRHHPLHAQTGHLHSHNSQSKAHSPAFDGKLECHSCKTDSSRSTSKPCSQFEGTAQDLSKIMTLQEQNEVLHHSLLQTAERMECLGEEFLSSHQLLELELQRTRKELGNLTEKFKSYSSTPHTNNLPEQKLHSMTMEGDALNQRISFLTEQLGNARTSTTRETLKVTSMLHGGFDHHYKSDISTSQFVVPAALPSEQIMDSNDLGKAISEQQDQPLGSVPEEEESDWSEIGEEIPIFVLAGMRSDRGHEQTAKNHGRWVRQGEGDADTESGGGEIIGRRAQSTLQVPRIQLSVYPENVPGTLAEAAVTDKGGFSVRYASYEDLRCLDTEAADDSDHEIVHRWRMTGGRQSESGSSLAGLQSAQKMLSDFICDILPSDGDGRDKVVEICLEGGRTKL